MSKTPLTQFLLTIRNHLQESSMRLWVQWVLVVIVVVGGIGGVGFGARSRSVAAQDVVAPAPAPPISDEAFQRWMATLERAALPETVSDFYDLYSLMSATTRVETQIQTITGTGTLSLTQVIYLPIMEKDFRFTSPLGDVTLVSGPTPCDGETCFDIRVECEQLHESCGATLKVGGSAAAARGTIVLYSGWTGQYLWEEGNEGCQCVVDELQAAGYRTVQIRWNSTWWDGATGELEGVGKLACRPASVTRWIYENLHQGEHVPFCALGHSNGASEVGYAITQYGLADLFSVVLFESGPNFARLDHGCIEDTSDPVDHALFYPQNARANVDMTFGLGCPGPCFEQDVSFQDRFEQASLAFGGNWQFYYPNTMLAFVFGETDLSTTAVHGAYYHNRVLQAESPLVSMQVVTGTGHFVTETAQGQRTIRDTLVSECVSR